MEEPILSLEKAAMERWRKGDPWGFIALSAEDIIYIDPYQTKPILGLDAFTKLLSQAEGNINYQRSEFINPQTIVLGDSALLTYNYRSSVLNALDEVVTQTPWNATEVYIRRDHRWQIIHTHWSYIHQQVPDQVEIPIPIDTVPKAYQGVCAELMALETAAMERWRKGDPWGFIEISQQEVTYFDTGTSHRLDGRETLSAEYQRREGKIFYDVMDFIDPKVLKLGDFAVLVYRFLSTQLNPNGSIKNRTPWNCTEVFIQQNGVWRIIHTHWSYIYGMLTRDINPG